MNTRYASSELALSEAIRCVEDVLDCGEVPLAGSETTFEGSVPWTTVLRIMEDIGIDDPRKPPSEDTELWAVSFKDVGNQAHVQVTLAFGSDGKLCAAGLYAD